MKVLSNVFCILCLPAFLLNPTSASSLQTPPTIQETAWDVPIDEVGSVNPWVLFQGETLSIDRYFAFIDLASSETFLETLSEEDLGKIVIEDIRGSKLDDLELFANELEEDFNKCNSFIGINFL